jgi:hypothetical protein
MKCDRCGKYVDRDDIPQIRGWVSERAMRVGNSLIRMDLCPECFDALKDFLANGEKKDACIDCKFFSDKEFYADNTVTVCAVSFGSCIEAQRNITSTSPNTETPSWCPLKGDKDE